MQGVQAPPFLGILAIMARNESSSSVDYGNISLSTYLAIIRLTSACVIGFCCRAEKSSFCCLDDFAPCPSLLVDDELSYVVEVSVFLATSFVDACVVVRCFIKLELLKTDVDKVFALGPGHNVHLTFTFLPLTSMNWK